MSWRIALSGSAGVGKSTLARALAERLGLPYVAEGMRERIEGGLVLSQLDLADRLRLFEELWQEQREREAACVEGFVSDRSSLDYFAFWMHYDFHHDLAATQARFHDLMEASRSYDHILLLRWGILPLADDGVRSTNPWIQLRFQGILEIVLRRFALPGRVLEVPATTELDARLAFVLGQLGVD